MAQLVSISLQSILQQVMEPCVQLSDGTTAATAEVIFLWSERWCSFITLARFGIRPRSVGCGMGQSFSTSQTGRKWRTRQAPQ